MAIFTQFGAPVELRELVSDYRGHCGDQHVIFSSTSLLRIDFFVDNYLKPYGDIEMQRRMVSDLTRTNAFAAAIKEVVRQGDIVLDVGTGTGILAMLAAKAGAGKVYGVDLTDIADVARDLARINGLAEKVHFIRDSAGELVLDTKVDLLISEWLGNAVFVEGMLPAVLAARDNNLASTGRMMPHRVRVLIAPLDEPLLYHAEGPGFWREPIHDLDFSSLQELELSQGRSTQIKIDSATMLAPGKSIIELDLQNASVDDVYSECELEFVASRDGVLNGFCIWFEADLSPSVTLDTGPLSPDTHWAQIYVSFVPQLVRAGERLEVSVQFSYDPDPDAVSRDVELCLHVGESELRYLID